MAIPYSSISEQWHLSTRSNSQYQLTCTNTVPLTALCIYITTQSYMIRWYCNICDLWAGTCWWTCIVSLYHLAPLCNSKLDVALSKLIEYSFRLPLYFIVLSITKMAITLEPYPQIWCGFQRGIGLNVWNANKWKWKLSFGGLFSNSNSFCLIASHILN